jgi:RNA recognition motif-containing protein
LSKKIYVGNLNYATTEDQLSQAFAQYGSVVSAKIITDRYTDRSKGFGFIEMEEDDAAEAAISALNGQQLDGRELRVSEANDRKPRENRFQY